MHASGRLYCDQASGFFVSDHRCDDTTHLLAGLPHGVLLQNMHGELAVLVSAAAKPVRPQTELFPGTELPCYSHMIYTLTGAMTMHASKCGPSCQPADDTTQNYGNGYRPIFLGRCPTVKFWQCGELC